MEKGFTYRTKCNQGRATYQPDFDSILPWAVFVDGACVAHRGSLTAAKILLYEYGCNTEDFRMAYSKRKFSKSSILLETATWNGIQQNRCSDSPPNIQN